jgi:threonine synthase
LFRLAESDAELNALKAMVENADAFFYPNDSSTTVRAPQMLDSLPTQSREIIHANMKQSASLNLEILKFLYPRIDLDAAGEGFVVTCSDEEALKLIKDSAITSGHIVDMLTADMS